MKPHFIPVSSSLAYKRLMPSERELIAHVLRRTTFGPFPGQINELTKLGPLGTVELALSAKPEIPNERLDSKEDYGQRMTLWWIERMLDPRPNLHERMVWYWHGHLVSSLDKASEAAMWRQHLLLRKHALGNFRELMQAIVIDPAMLNYLDGNGSRGENPNENLARELMELFTLGSGNYTEDDIRAAARGLTGWEVDNESLKLKWNAEGAYDRPVAFMGSRRVWTASALVDAICDHPACARHVATRLHQWFVGARPSDKRADELAALFRKNNLEIRPVVENVLKSKEFFESIHTRPRTGLEWLVPALALTGNTKQTEKFKIELSWFDQLGQMPFRPPNVAGWPVDERWLAAGQMLTRTSLLTRLPLARTVIERVEPTVDGVLAHCGLFDVSESTRSAMQQALNRQTEYAKGLELLLTLALISPEFSLL